MTQEIFRKGDLVEQGKWRGVVTRASSSLGKARVQWHKGYWTTEDIESLNFAEPQPLDRILALEEFTKARNADAA